VFVLSWDKDLFPFTKITKKRENIWYKIVRRNHLCIKNKNIFFKRIYLKNSIQFSISFVVFNVHCSVRYYNLRIENICEGDTV